MIEVGDVTRIIDELVGRFEIAEGKGEKAVETWAAIEGISDETLAFVASQTAILIANAVTSNEIENLDDFVLNLRSAALTTFAIGFEMGREYGRYTGAYGD